MRTEDRIKTDQIVLDKLAERGVTIREIAELVIFTQERHTDGLTIEACESNVLSVLRKREVQNAVMTGIQLDELADKKLLCEPLQTMVETDMGMYGIDEILALSIVNVYGSIAITNFGYLDVLKPEGVMKKLNQDKSQCNCFLDDIVAAIAAAAASRIVHNGEFAKKKP